MMRRLWCWLFHRQYRTVFIGPSDPWRYCAKCDREWGDVL